MIDEKENPLSYMLPSSVSKDLIRCLKSSAKFQPNEAEVKVELVDHRNSEKEVKSEDTDYACNVVDYDLQVNFQLPEEVLSNTCDMMEGINPLCELIGSREESNGKYIYTFTVATQYNVQMYTTWLMERGGKS